MKFSKKSNKKSRSVVTLSRAERIPSLKTNVVVRHKYRFECSFLESATKDTFTISADQLMLCMGCAGTGDGTPANTQVEALFQSLRLVEIEAWAPYVGTSHGTVAVEWLGTYGSSQEVSDTTYSPTVLAHIRARPPKQSSASFWNQGTLGTVLCAVTASSGAVVDFTLEGVLSDPDGTFTPPNITLDPGASLPFLTAVQAGTVAYSSLKGVVGLNLVAFNLSTFLPA